MDTLIYKSREAPLDEIRRWLKMGATIKATDPNGLVLQEGSDGIWHAGLTIMLPNGVYRL